MRFFISTDGHGVCAEIETISKNKRHWFSSSFAALLDQFVYAGTFFILNILLARWLDCDSYGIYTFIYSIYLFSAGLHSVVIIEPVLVFGNSRFGSCFKEYIGKLVLLHFLFLLVILIVFLLTSIIIYPIIGFNTLANSFGVAFATPLLLLVILCRRSYYARQESWGALKCSVMFSMLVLTGVIYLFHKDYLSPLSIFIILAMSALTASSFILFYIRPAMFSKSICNNKIISTHINYGKWTIAAVVIIWLYNNIYIMVLPIKYGFSAIAEIRSVMNFLLPVIHFLFAISQVLLPEISEMKNSGRDGKIRTYLRKYTIGMLLIVILYSAVMYIFRDTIYIKLYDGKYLEYSYLTAYILPLLSIIVITSVLEVSIKASGDTKKIFSAYFAKLIFAVLFIIPLCIYYGVAGALAGITLGNFVTAAVYIKQGARL